jgi:phage baseplate assembly protein W
MKGIGYFGEESPIIKHDLDLLEESITRILLTVPGERVGNVNFGSRLQNYLFDLSAVFIEEARADIYSSISKWEPRVNIDNITIEIIDSETAKIRIECIVKETLEEFVVEKILRF